MNSSIKKVLLFYVAIFALLIIYLLYFVLFSSKNVIGNSYNPRIAMAEENTNIIRGDILDRNNVVLATTAEDGTRKYPFGSIFAHVVGFNTNGKSGAEVKYNFELLKSNIKSDGDEPVKGNSVVLTLDKDLQELAYNKLGDNKGAIVALDSTTGEVLAMVSSPSFDPETLEETWDTLSNDTQNSPLLNRATQGLYPPASVFKIIMSIAFMNSGINWEDYTYTCNGYYSYNGKTISCYNGNAHGTVDLKQALTVSCNSFFISLYNKLSTVQVANTAQKFMFNKSLDFPLEYKESSFPLSPLDNVMTILQTYMGQGETLITPLHMALIGAAIANDGVMMKPYILKSIVGADGEVLQTTKAQKLKKVTSAENAQKLREMLVNVVQNGTATKAKNSYVSIAGKTGTAQVEGQKDHSWFLAMAPADNPTFVVAVLLENSGSSSLPVEIARDLILAHFGY